MSILIKALFVIGVSYLIGSISFALLIGKGFYGIDIREQGSGNLGATNTFRVLGITPGILVLICDILKGVVSVGLASLFFRDAPTLFNSFLQTGTSFASYSMLDSTVIVAAGFAVIAGHNWSIFLRFSGGKGMATTTGVLLVIAPKIVFALFLIWLIVFALTRYVSLSSVIVAATFPFFMIYFYRGNYPYIAFSLIDAVVTIYKHRSNMKQLLKGKESKIGKKS
ncbi:glycerol-3-phosphate 1-O-acyltransferase PlsY [Candidatus Oleimmundimicrobium sp.]|uniref:glycerol-3-phosphate 1-O-acyltransferase PlsY n=1 Tax=Candidatus Oleimmundimicrobium sp. TaxID=3060597 RepID=UPI002718E894|nr:glycerol-3-phosphate 1-O-acyltransferase PlsY [Candidatus Oleimmundimicrobium sp.]MDO8885306.1 glycerol-3-phosphate 1-O-acyltransferase PlsY [Candidatus Oleimmundimicrobium sp.]